MSPAHPGALLLLGVICGRTGRWGEADRHLSLAVDAQPEREDALFWLAQVKRNLGQLQAAIELCERALVVNPENPAVLNELALSYMAVDLPQACEVLRKAIQIDPASSYFHLNMGLALRRMSLLYPARLSLEEALRLNPDLTAAYFELAAVLELLGATKDAIEMLGTAVARQQDNYQLAYLLAIAYSNDGNRDQAESVFRQTLEIEPKSGNAFGFWLQQAGRFDESVGCFEVALKADPIQGAAFYGLAEAKAYRVDDKSLISRATPVLDSLGPNLEEKAYLCYSLAAAYEHEKQFEEAMRHFDMANGFAYQAYNAARSYEHAERKQQTDNEIALYNKEGLEVECQGSSLSVQPIFIVGMVRSGTTLLDQIVSRHSDVESAGEPVFWIQESDVLRRRGVTELSAEELMDLSTRYLAALEPFGRESQRITDKMPLNYGRLGLIHSVFPRAKVIHLRRNPLDTCLSIYTTFFGQGPSFAYKQENIVFNYLEYMRLMEHWRSILPQDKFLEIDYEELVANQEPVVRKVLEFCDLPWQESCLHPGANASAIRTPSVWQARQPVYNSSVQRWRRFGPWLGELAALQGIEHPPTRGKLAPEPI